MYISKEDLIKRIKEIPSDLFEVVIQQTEQESSFDLPDLRCGVINSPQPMVKRTYDPPVKLRFEITTEIHKHGGE